MDSLKGQEFVLPKELHETLAELFVKNSVTSQAMHQQIESENETEIDEHLLRSSSGKLTKKFDLNPFAKTFIPLVARSYNFPIPSSRIEVLQSVKPKIVSPDEERDGDNCLQTVDHQHQPMPNETLSHKESHFATANEQAGQAHDEAAHIMVWNKVFSDNKEKRASIFTRESKPSLQVETEIVGEGCPLCQNRKCKKDTKDVACNTSFSAINEQENDASKIAFEVRKSNEALARLVEAQASQQQIIFKHLIEFINDESLHRNEANVEKQILKQILDENKQIMKLLGSINNEIKEQKSQADNDEIYSALNISNEKNCQPMSSVSPHNVDERNAIKTPSKENMREQMDSNESGKSFEMQNETYENIPVTVENLRTSEMSLGDFDFHFKEPGPSNKTIPSDYDVDIENGCVIEPETSNDGSFGLKKAVSYTINEKKSTPRSMNEKNCKTSHSKSASFQKASTVNVELKIQPKINGVISSNLTTSTKYRIEPVLLQDAATSTSHAIHYLVSPRAVKNCGNLISKPPKIVEKQDQEQEEEQKDFAKPINNQQHKNKKNKHKMEAEKVNNSEEPPLPPQQVRRQQQKPQPPTPPPPPPPPPSSPPQQQQQETVPESKRNPLFHNKGPTSSVANEPVPFEKTLRQYQPKLNLKFKKPKVNNVENTAATKDITNWVFQNLLPFDPRF